MDDIKIIAARTHSPEYLLHKYWSRKPHNILSYFIQALVPENGVVVDPFCGSGVVLHEAQKLGRTAYGFDINPTACLISGVLIDPPDKERFERTVKEILDSVETEALSHYSCDGKKIKYCIHSIVAHCPKCSKVLHQSHCIFKGKALYCDGCGAKAKFNLEHLVSTQVIGVVFDGDRRICTDDRILKEQQKHSAMYISEADCERYTFQFAENRRILAFDGMSTKDLFTNRNFSVVCRLADEFKKIKDPKIRAAAQLMLSASIAQCSRLIANRNNLSTGGPAWSIPGFWVPAVHLESNPFVHLRARLKKFIKGLPEPSGSPAYVEKADSRKGLNDLYLSGISADLIFFDPPYGDSVPFIEFSSMWNSFLDDFPDPDEDISVSDRTSRKAAWVKYSDDINTSISAIRRVLKDSGHLLITFNNNDMRAWNALLTALQQNNMKCEFVTYQIPAVISSKAQKAIEGSYISDIYSIYSKSDTYEATHSLAEVSNELIKCAKYRGGKISRSLALRTLIIAWLKHNVAAELLSESEAILESLFDISGEDLTLKGYDTSAPSLFVKDARASARALLSNGPLDWSVLYQKTVERLAEYGIPDAHELRAALDGCVLFNNNRCIAYADTEQTP